MVKLSCFLFFFDFFWNIEGAMIGWVIRAMKAMMEKLTQNIDLKIFMRTDDFQLKMCVFSGEKQRIWSHSPTSFHAWETRIYTYADLCKASRKWAEKRWSIPKIHFTDFSILQTLVLGDLRKLYDWELWATFSEWRTGLSQILQILS